MRFLKGQFEYTDRNHLKIEFASPTGDFEPGAEYCVTSGRPRRTVGTPIDEARICAQKIQRHARGREIYLCMSGGIDSEAMAEAFLKAKVPFTVAIMEFNDSLNDYDILAAKEFATNHSLKVRVFSIDIIKFFTSGEYLKYALDYTLVSPQLCAHIKFLESLRDGVPVFAWNPPFGALYGKFLAPMLPQERYFAYERYFRKTKRSGVGTFFLYTPELVHSFFKLNFIAPYLTATASDNLQNALEISYELKCRIYREGGFEALPRKDKYTGFEKVKRRFYEMFGQSEDIFNELYRYPLERKFPTSHVYSSIF